ncbi:MAG: hypothetical protein COA88_09215 [Kordia sp.]|nr:MAG: hypothetical protein COA88_09215 [Kordia sp.]
MIRYAFLIFLIFGCKTKTDVDKNIESINKVEPTFCQILDSIVSRKSSIPYDTYRGTPYLKKTKVKNGEDIVYHFYEKYPEYNEDGFVNGGKVTLSNIILRNAPRAIKITVKSKEKTIIIDNSKIEKINNSFYIINFPDYFGDTDPFYTDKIDFEVIFQDSGIGDSDPILVGVYWDTLRDYYNNEDCDNVNFSNW